MDTKQQQENAAALAREYASTVFGLEYENSIRIIPEGVAGDFRVKDDINIDDRYIFQTLLKGTDVIANNDPRELNAHRFFLKAAHGRILISGLGLGDSLNEVLKKPDVEFVRVVESEQTVIDLVAPSFSGETESGRGEIVQGDIFDYAPGEHFDCIYHAIWHSEKACRAAVQERRELKDRFARLCDWMGFIHLSPRGGRRSGAGRRAGSRGPVKPEIDKRTIQKGIRYKPREMELINQACKISGAKASELAVRGAVKEAVRIIYRVDDSRIDELVKKAL